ncbi:sulfur carrier protein ThiS [Catelliglobosispora koreensis]|uniref:sulfur carrier protein ThiS n=1 Tax=Catelliglobosispora koreensis TaxID=129052 RepID=UPI0003701AD3|nr:sulfur carrier protein ThiS [Catelliglobosispora koreensis]
MILLNGAPVLPRETVSLLLSTMDLPPRGVAVAVNGEVVPRSAWESHLLADGDSVEVLTAAQGG